LFVPNPSHELDGSFRFEDVFAKNLWAIGQGVLGLNFTTVYREPQGSGTHREKRSGFGEIHPALGGFFVVAIRWNAMMTAQSGYSFAGPAITTPVRNPLRFKMPAIRSSDRTPVARLGYAESFHAGVLRS
jgi:hypothetical protein